LPNDRSTAKAFDAMGIANVHIELCRIANPAVMVDARGFVLSIEFLYKRDFYKPSRGLQQYLVRISRLLTRRSSPEGAFSRTCRSAVPGAGPRGRDWREIGGTSESGKHWHHL
jgi:hypothetical protein